jgi:hypothetical protein
MLATRIDRVNVRFESGLNSISDPAAVIVRAMLNPSAPPAAAPAAAPAPPATAPPMAPPRTAPNAVLSALLGGGPAHLALFIYSLYALRVLDVRQFRHHRGCTVFKSERVKLKLNLRFLLFLSWP